MYALARTYTHLMLYMLAVLRFSLQSIYYYLCRDCPSKQKLVGFLSTTPDIVNAEGNFSFCDFDLRWCAIIWVCVRMRVCVCMELMVQRQYTIKSLLGLVLKLIQLNGFCHCHKSVCNLFSNCLVVVVVFIIIFF